MVVVVLVVVAVSSPLAGAVVVVVVGRGRPVGSPLKSVPVITVTWAPPRPAGHSTWSSPTRSRRGERHDDLARDRPGHRLGRRLLGRRVREYSTTVSACAPTSEVYDTPITSKPSAWRPASAVWPACEMPEPFSMETVTEAGAGSGSPVKVLVVGSVAEELVDDV